MRRRLVLSFVALSVVLLVGFAVPLERFYAGTRVTDAEARLVREAYLLAASLDQTLRPDPAALASVDALLAGDVERVVVVDANGVSVVDSAGPIDRRFLTRPEIAAALEGKPSTGSRFSVTLSTTLLYAAVPVRDGSTVVGAVRLTLDGDELRSAVWFLRAELTLAGLVALAVAVATGTTMARWLTRPIEALRTTAARHGAGDLTARAALRRAPAELVELAHASNTAAERIESLLDARARFAADAAHQLRTPLAALVLRLELLAQTHAGEDSEAALRAAQQLAGLADRLLAQARGQQAAPQLADVDVTDLVDDVLSSFALLAESHEILLHRKPSALVICRTDPTLLRVVCAELVANAIDVSPDAAVVEVEVRPLDGGDVEVRVADEGPGLSDEELKRAFDPFWRRSHRADTIGSSGLGLTQAATAAAALGGYVALARRTPRGIVATCTLPAADDLGDPAHPG